MKKIHPKSGKKRNYLKEKNRHQRNQPPNTLWWRNMSPARRCPGGSRRGAHGETRSSHPSSALSAEPAPCSRGRRSPACEQQGVPKSPTCAQPHHLEVRAWLNPRTTPVQTSYTSNVHAGWVVTGPLPRRNRVSCSGGHSALSSPPDTQAAAVQH